MKYLIAKVSVSVRGQELPDWLSAVLTYMQAVVCHQDNVTKNRISGVCCVIRPAVISSKRVTILSDWSILMS